MRMLIVLCAVLCVAFPATAQTPDEGTREIWDLGFRAKRPATQQAGSTPKPGGKPIIYHQVPVATPARPLSAVAPSRQTVGITVWQLRRAEATDSGARLLMQETPSSKPVEYVPYRIRLDQPLHVGDCVRVAIEFPREGFLYVVDRERYGDGKVGDPYLIFPVENLNHGDNHVSPGRLIEIPGQADPVSALKVVRRDERHIGEELLVLFSPERLTSVPVAKPNTALPAELVENWERELPAATLRLDLAADGDLWTTAEKSAGADQRLLTQADPMPQSIFAAAAAPNGPFLVHVPLEVRE
jgi:hypothetical protein